MIDLRSDTVTKPVAEMREEMARAEVGDDVYGEDPTVNELQKMVAERFDRESALFVPSGSMGNQIAVNIHTVPGNEVILDSECHLYNYEMGNMSIFSGVQPRPIETSKKYLPLGKVRGKIRPEKYYVSKTGLIALENTHNMKGGVVYPETRARELLKLAEEKSISIHLDGARIFNAAVATNRPVDDLTGGFDSVMFCLSKGLGAPIGSMLTGSKEFIEKARRVRKRLGGGMRQVGVLAAAGIYALENHVERLEEDHQNARFLADCLEDLDQIEVKTPETNIVMFRLNNSAISSRELVEKLRERNVLVGKVGPQSIRMVIHLDVNGEDVEEAAEAIKSIF
ncbi:threonine aldolase [candidate division MSBL1 archaeon SCGC-AAA259A05]|uniref:Threonine aldolase n=1 Tax=candidate division MSBL1 archaeon SCGC-AAA259A05 TaxID=1698259 RepID=A0A133U542_9EURY|nr:threonine aldolase [candidate division MSBL1 archaeon SCGC-AAA259A05]